MAVLLATDIYTLIDEEVVQPLDDFIKTDATTRPGSRGFMPAYLKSAQVDGKLWSAPFQRSTAVLYWNKKAFAEAGLDPREIPDDLGRDGALRQGRDEEGCVGPGVTAGVSAFRAMSARRSGSSVRSSLRTAATLFNEKGTETYLTDPKVVEALQFWVDLSKVYAIHPPGIQEWGTTPSDFLEGRIAMIWTTTGNLTNIRKNARFDFGVAPYPGKVAPASVLGGGNLYIFAKASQAEKDAAFKFIKFLTSDELQADWAIQTGLRRAARRRLGDRRP